MTMPCEEEAGAFKLGPSTCMLHARVQPRAKMPVSQQKLRSRDVALNVEAVSEALLPIQRSSHSIARIDIGVPTEPCENCRSKHLGDGPVQFPSVQETM